MDTYLDPIATLVEYLRFPSISIQREHTTDLRNCAAWLELLFQQIGLVTTLHETEGHPILIAKTIPDPSKKTVLIYGHYDVQPPEPLEEWISPPFEPRIDELEETIYARGSSDNKAPTLAHILGVAQSLEEKGTLPVNVIFLIEGEEEMGSPNLDHFLTTHRQELACDVIVISDTGMAPGNLPAITYTLRGVATMECIVRGPAYDLHSGVFGGAVANPLTVAARLIASLHDDQGHVLIPGFYNEIEPLQPWEKTALQALEEASPADALIKNLAGVKELFGEAGFSTLERIGVRPTVEVNGFGGGYQGIGIKTILPKEAFVKLSFRLVAAQDPNVILQAAAAYLKKQLPPGISLDIALGHFSEPCVMNPKSPHGQAACQALEESFGTSPFLLRDGASIPIVSHFQKIFGVEILLIGLANPNCRMHSPNENMLLKNFFSGIQLNQILLEKLAASTFAG